MSDDKLSECVHGLIEKAASAEKSDDALKFSQAACNAANAIQVFEYTNKQRAAG